MSGFYRIGAPGEDALVHLNTGRKPSGKRCEADRFEKDDPQIGESCGRQSVILCDGPGCDIPVCELHRTKHQTKPDTDYCPDHKELATS